MKIDLNYDAGEPFGLYQVCSYLYLHGYNLYVTEPASKVRKLQ